MIHMNNTKWSERNSDRSVNGNSCINFVICLARVCRVSQNQHKYAYLRMLFSELTGKTYFEDVSTYDNHVLPAYGEACRSRRIIEEDAQ